MICVMLFVGLFHSHAQTHNEDAEKTALTVFDNEFVEIQSIHVVIDGKNIADIDTDAKNTRNTIPRLALMMKCISFRSADVLHFKNLRRKMYFSFLRLQNLPYFYSSSTENGVSYKIHESTSESNKKHVSIYFTLKKRKSLLFGFGNAYGIIGIYRPIGLDLVIYAGVNRQEIDLQYKAIPFRFRNGRYGRSFFSVGKNLYHYWLLPVLSTTELSVQSLLYGADAFVRFSLHPSISYKIGTSFTGQSTIKKKNPAVADADIAQSGLARVGQTNLSIDVRNSLRYALTFGDTGVYKSTLQIKIPYILGFANLREKNTPKLYDIIGISVAVQSAFVTALVHHAVRIRAGFITSFIRTSARPFHAKANVLEGFYNTTAREISLQRRGIYPLNTSIGDMGYSISIEYLIGGVSTDILGFSAFVFYDGAAAANTYAELLSNTRHTIGPGILFHFFQPLNIDCRFSLGFGGQLLGNPDGNALSFSFSVATH